MFCFAIIYSDCFTRLINNEQHDAESITNHILRTLMEYEINLDNCRGQNYNNTSNLTGKYIGVQARLKTLNSLIVNSMPDKWKGIK